MFSEELNSNLQSLDNTKYILYSNIKERTGHAIHAIPLTTGVWQLASGSDELKYLPSSLLSKVMLAYTKINNFNDFLLEVWRPKLEEERSERISSSEISDAYQHIKTEATNAISNALQELNAYRASTLRADGGGDKRGGRRLKM